MSRIFYKEPTIKYQIINNTTIKIWWAVGRGSDFYHVLNGVTFTGFQKPSSSFDDTAYPIDVQDPSTIIENDNTIKNSDN